MFYFIIFCCTALVIVGLISLEKINELINLNVDLELMVLQKTKFKNKYLKTNKKVKNLKRRINSLSKMFSIINNNLEISTSQFDKLQEAYLELKDKSYSEIKPKGDKSIGKILLDSINEKIKKKNLPNLSSIFNDDIFNYDEKDLKDNDDGNSFTVMISENEHLKDLEKCKNDTVGYEILSSLGNIRFINKYLVKNNGKWKLIFSCDNTNCLIIKDDSFIHSKSFCHFEINSYFEAIMLRTYLHSTLPQFLYKVYNNYSHIPIIDLSKYWTDSEVYKYFEFNNDEISFIKSF